MNHDLAEHISLLAAPLYAMLIAQQAGYEVPAARLSELRRHAITQAHALWLDTLERGE